MIRIPSPYVQASIIILVLVCTSLIVFHESLLLSIGDFLVVEDPLQPANVIHVIAGDEYRTDYAIQLYKAGYAKTIFFTGGWCIYHGYWHGEHGLQRSTQAGVPADAVAFDDSAVMSTYMEAERLNVWISRSPIPIRSVIVVSDPFHMRRARWTYRRVLGKDMQIRMAPVPFEQTPYQRAWWRDGASRRYVIEEYQKFGYYLARYQMNWRPLQTWLASLDQE